MVEISASLRQTAEKAIRVLSRLGRVEAAYLFGSQVNGTADEWSDTDIAVFMEGVENWDFMTRTDAFILVMDECGHDVEAHLFPASAALHPMKASFAEYIIKHGVMISLESAVV